MGRRGPATKPSVLKLVDGTQHSKINLDEPVVRNEAPDCPADASPAVRVVWDETVDNLLFMRLARKADSRALRCFCEAVVNHDKASAILAQSPILIKGAMGGLVRNPAFAIQRDSAHVIRQFAQEFGLTPSARSSIVVGDQRASDEQQNPFADVG